MCRRKNYMKQLYSTLAIIFLFSFITLSQEKFFPKADNLVTYGVPQIPQNLVADVGRYSDFRSAGFVNWHPTKREMIITTRFSDVNQLHYVKFPGGARKQITFFDEPVTSASFEPISGNYFLFNKDIGGNENFQIFKFNLSDGKYAMLTDGKSQNGGVLWSNKKDKIVYSSTKRNGRDRDFYLMDPLNPAGEKLILQNQGGGWGVSDWSPDDTKLLVIQTISVNESNVYLLDLTTSEKKLVSPKIEGEKISNSGGRFSKDGSGIFFTSDKNSEFKRLIFLDLKSEKISTLTENINWDVVEFDLSPNKEMLTYVINENGNRVVYLHNLISGKTRKLDHLPFGIVRRVVWHNNNEDLAFTFSSAKMNSDVYSYNIKTKDLERWTFSETAGINTENFSVPKLIKWNSFDGLEITGFLYSPPKTFTGKRPVIIDVHGGPEAQSIPTFLGIENYLINELGVAIIFPNKRGSTGFGKTFVSLDNGFLRENSYKDIVTLIDWIKTQPDLDADRIMITGGSYGGNVTLYISAFYSDKIACGLSVVGSSNFVTFLENTADYRRDLRRVEYGDERIPEMREFLNRIAPLNHAEKIKKPLFIVQGANDPRVPMSESEQLVEKLKSINTPVWYLLAKDEGHGFAKRKNVDFEFYSKVMFIKEYLLK